MKWSPTRLTCREASWALNNSMCKIEHSNKRIESKIIPIIQILSTKDSRTIKFQKCKKETITAFIKTTWEMVMIGSANTWKSKVSLHNSLKIISSEMLRALRPKHFMPKSSNRATLSANNAWMLQLTTCPSRATRSIRSAQTGYVVKSKRKNTLRRPPTRMSVISTRSKIQDSLKPMRLSRTTSSRWVSRIGCATKRSSISKERSAMRWWHTETCLQPRNTLISPTCVHIKIMTILITLCSPVLSKHQNWLKIPVQQLQVEIDWKVPNP